MLEIADRIAALGFTHVVWIPDSHLGLWLPSLQVEKRLSLLQACREGEVVVLAAGLMLGGAHPLVIIQCTGFFEAGDAIRNVVHDLKLPLKMIVGVRSHAAHQLGKSKDNCPVFTEPIVQAWQLAHRWFNPGSETPAQRDAALQWLHESPTAAVLLWSE